MEKDRAAHKTQIIIAIIGVVGVLGGALFANWDKIFVPNPDQPVTQESETNSSTAPEESIYIISVYYYASRENDAERARRILEDNGYLVNTYSGSDLNEGRTISQSYIYFKDNDHEEMVAVRDILSLALDEQFTVHLSGPDRTDKTMRVVLVGDRS